MAQPRRIQFITLAENEPLPAAPAPEVAEGGLSPTKPEPTKVVETVTTVRFELQLFPSSENRCPEFFYPELVKAHETQKQPKTLEEVDAENERNELEALARKFEAKYGGPDKPRRDRMSDLVDIGEGYDDEDSFIDNTEAYDEFVPSSLTTEHGGFYINCGTLQYRRTSVSDGDVEEPKIVKKRKLKDGEQKLKKKKKRLEETATDAGASLMQEPIPAPDIPISSDPAPSEGRPPPQKKPRRPRTSPLSLDSVLRKLQQEKLQEFQPDKPLIAPPPTPLDVSPSPSPTSSTNPSTPPPTLTNQIIPSTRVTSENTPPTDLANRSTPPGSSIGPPVSSLTQKLLSTPPHGLPSPLRASIRDLTQAAKVSEGESKLKFFTEKVNRILLDVEVRSRELGPGVRSRVFTHLSTHLPFSKDTLLKRARKLNLKPQIGTLPEALQKLKEAIAMAMPEQIARYQEECNTLADAQNTKASSEGPERDVEGKKGGAEQDEEVKQAGKGAMSPQKRFHWNEELRTLLCDVVRMKLSSYEQEKPQQSNHEEYLRNFLESEVRPLWPKGWILTRILMKESRKAHIHFTSIKGNKSATNTKLKKSNGGGGSTDPSPSLGIVCQELAALSGDMKRHIQELHLPPAQGPSTASSSQPTKPLLGMVCPDPSLVLQPVEPQQPLVPSQSPPPGQAAEPEGAVAQVYPHPEGAVAQVYPHPGAASLTALRASLPSASLASEWDGPQKGGNQGVMLSCPLQSGSPDTPTALHKEESGGVQHHISHGGSKKHAEVPKTQKLLH